MADEVLIAKFEADLAGVKKQLDDYINALEKVQKEEKDTQKETAKTATTAESAAKKRSTAIKAEMVELARLKTAAKQAFTPEAIDNFNKKIAESKNRIALLKGETQNFGAGIKASLAGIGAGIAAAFSISSVIAFGKASINAFLEAEENAKRLEFAVTQIAGESEVAFDRLIRQSERLQDVSIFSDDAIQQSQTALATFGLLSDQIEKLTPRIIEFASATKTDLPSATDTFLRALEGQTRGLITAGAAFEDTGTIMGNYNKLLESTEKLTGATTEATQTLTGQLQQMQNRADELEESIGSRLAGSFVELRVATAAALESLLRFFEGAEGQRARNLKTSRDLIQASIEANIAGDAAISGLTIEQEAKKKLLEVGQQLNDLEKARRDAETKYQEEKGRMFNLEEREAAKKAIEDIKKQEGILRQQAGVITDLIALEKNRTATQIEALNAEKLRTIEVVELNRLLKENAIRSDVTSKDNVKLINLELEARKKLSDELAKRADIRTPGIEKEIKLVETLSGEYQDLLKLLSDPQVAQLVELSIKVSAEAEQDIKAQIDKLKTLFEVNKLELPVLVDKEGKLLSLENQFNTLKTTLETEGIEIDAAILLPSNEILRTEVARFVAGNEKELTVPMVIQPRVDDVAFNDGLDNITDAVELTTSEILSQSQQLIGELTNLYSAFANKRVDDIQKATDSEIENIDRSLQANEDALKNRRISERDATNEKIRLEEEKVKAEQDADKKIRAIKRQQAIINKIAALADIAISTAKNVAEFPALAAFYLGIGAAQAAIVAATPIPYKKGTKNSKQGLALVGEEGPEQMMLPAGTKILDHKKSKKNKEVFDAMYDDRLEQYIFKNYITPHLMAQKREAQQQDHKTFSRALSDSLIVNVAAPAMKKQDRFAMTNVDELADAIVRSSYISPYRR